ncbi:MutS-related protein [Mucilaginibacter gotjawali]|nr:DNA mismatch repair protein [Mucilaginibacter gotjawali]MBB3053809.1 DNA mismatch repair ATPase MutS [Mucilaginibacter gotjawali]
MFLSTDEQTIEDLGLFGNRNNGGIYDIYNAANTRGGEAILKDMFRNPLSDRDAINQRSSIIEHFARMNMAFPFSASSFDMAEKYLLDNVEQSKGTNQQTSMLSEKEMLNGVSAVIDILWTAKTFIENRDVASVFAYKTERDSIVMLLRDAAFTPALREKPQGKLPYSAITAYDILFRVREYDKIKKLLKHIYTLDVYLSVAKVAVKRNFVFPSALEKGSCELALEDVYQPELKKPVGNSVFISPRQNIIFLTGANMAGKSTFLRAVSTAVYVAHMGFPVAARSMAFSVMDGVYTTINLPDKLGIGASHFYVEVLRVRKMATELSHGKSLFIVFDELFRGTNVKDAHEATVAVTNAFAGKKTSMFIISSHIVEAAEQLKLKSNIGFQYLPTIMNGTVPEYTYTLRQGVTDDRHGMIIIRNEGILDILKNGLKKKVKHLDTVS